MGLKSYQETIVHDRDAEGRGESNVFALQYPDGSQKCHKEYIPNLDYTLLKDYHILHNYLAQHPISYDVVFPFKGNQISRLTFSVVSLGSDLFKASSLSSKQEICTATIPYVGGDGFDDVARTSADAMSVLCITLDQFAKDISSSHSHLFTTSDILKENLCGVNMKCIVEGNEMKIYITDLCGRMRQLYELCDEVQLGLLSILSDRKNAVS